MGGIWHVIIALQISIQETEQGPQRIAHIGPLYALDSSLGTIGACDHHYPPGYTLHPYQCRTSCPVHSQRCWELHIYKDFEVSSPCGAWPPGSHPPRSLWVCDKLSHVLIDLWVENSDVPSSPCLILCTCVLFSHSPGQICLLCPTHLPKRALLPRLLFLLMPEGAQGPHRTARETEPECP